MTKKILNDLDATGRTITASTFSGSLSNSFTLKADTGTAEGTDLYTFNGGGAKTLNIVAGSNITITKTSGQWSIASSGGSSAPYGPRYLVTNYVYAPIGLQGQGGTATFTANLLHAIPFYVPTTKTAVSLYINISALNSTSGGVRLGIYTNSSTDDYPNALVSGSDTGIIPTDTLQATGPTYGTISCSLTGGNLYWLVAVRQGTSNPTLYSLGSSSIVRSVLPAGSNTATTYGAVAWTQASVTGALPSTFTATKTLATTAPAVWIGF